MLTVEEIKTAIEALPDDSYTQLRDWDKWDSQLEEDVHTGRLDFLAQGAFREKSEGGLKEL